METLLKSNFSPEILQKVDIKSKEIFDESYHKLCRDTDNVFAVLLVFQWIAAVVISIFITPKTWIGTQEMVNVHVYASIIIGGALTIFPIYLIKTEPGAEINRFANVVAQALYSVLFIHLTGGRIETHFHIFGSLAFFSFYRDVRLLIVGSLVVVVDHMVRGIWFPQSVFGIFISSDWRWLEHAGWVLFEDFFLSYSCIRSLNEMKLVARRTAEVLIQHENAEELVLQRTAKIKEQQMLLINSAKLSSLGEMAAGIAHEINNPLSVISVSNRMLRRIYAGQSSEGQKYLDNIDKTVTRITHIVQGLRTLSRDSTNENFGEVKLRDLMNDVLTLCSERFKQSNIKLLIDLNDPIYEALVPCKRVQLSQVLINLLGNAFDAIEEMDEKWVKVECKFINEFFEIRVIDSGPGISLDIQQKIFSPFFTTKPVGKGTGLGLSLSASIINDHHGTFTLDNQCKNTCFVLRFPLQIRKAA